MSDVLSGIDNQYGLLLPHILVLFSPFFSLTHFHAFIFALFLFPSLQPHSGTYTHILSYFLRLWPGLQIMLKDGGYYIHELLVSHAISLLPLAVKKILEAFNSYLLCPNLLCPNSIA